MRRERTPRSPPAESDTGEKESGGTGDEKDYSVVALCSQSACLPTSRSCRGNFTAISRSLARI